MKEEFDALQEGKLAHMDQTFNLVAICFQLFSHLNTHTAPSTQNEVKEELYHAGNHPRGKLAHMEQRLSLLTS